MDCASEEELSDCEESDFAGRTGTVTDQSFESGLSWSLPGTACVNDDQSHGQDDSRALWWACL